MVKYRRQENKMSLIQFNFESEYLYSNTTVGIILPERPQYVPSEKFYKREKKYKVLWLLHGTYGDWSDWIRKTRIELYATEHDLICVLPSALNSDYTSWPSFSLGYDMEAHLIKELMPLIHNWFPASEKKEDNYIAGLSMGGRGALSYILDYPELFSSAAILSYVPEDFSKPDWDEKYRSRRDSISATRLENRIRNAGGKEAYERKNNYREKLFKMHDEGILPNLFFACGTKDALYYEEFKLFRAECEKRNIPINFMEEDGMKHEWRFWEDSIKVALKNFGI